MNRLASLDTLSSLTRGVRAAEGEVGGLPATLRAHHLGCRGRSRFGDGIGSLLLKERRLKGLVGMRARRGGESTDDSSASGSGARLDLG